MTRQTQLGPKKTRLRAFAPTGYALGTLLVVGLLNANTALAEDSFCNSDFDADGSVSFADYTLLANTWAPDGCDNCVADADKDGDVDFGDFNILSTEYGRTDCPLPSGPRVLLIHDGITETAQSLHETLVDGGAYVRFSDTDESAYNGQNPAPEHFDLVITLNDDYWANMPASGEQALDDFASSTTTHLNGRAGVSQGLVWSASTWADQYDVFTLPDSAWEDELTDWYVDAHLGTAADESEDCWTRFEHTIASGGEPFPALAVCTLGPEARGTPLHDLRVMGIALASFQTMVVKENGNGEGGQFGNGLDNTFFTCLLEVAGVNLAASLWQELKTQGLKHPYDVFKKKNLKLLKQALKKVGAKWLGPVGAVLFLAEMGVCMHFLPNWMPDILPNP